MLQHRSLPKAIGTVLCAGVIALSAGGSVTPAQAQEMPPSFAPVVKELLPAVVNISTTRSVEQNGPNGQLPEGHPLRKFFDRFGGEGPRRQMRSLGSGFIIDESGYVVTNNHVVEGADRVTVILDDDTEFKAEIAGTDPKTDLAVLKVKADRDLPAVEWGNSETAEIGDWVLAIGNPFGLGGSVTAGIVSARGRAINAGPYSRFIQTDTAINRGNSGGPLFNTDGDVIGVNTAILSPSGGNVGVGFALPSRVAQPIVQELRETGKVTRGWLGVSVQPLTGDLAQGLEVSEDKGALVGDVTSGSPADEAGLKSGDVVLEMNGTPVDDPRDLAWMTSQQDPGETAKLKIWRDGEETTRSVTLGKLSDHTARASGMSESDLAKATARTMGVKLAPSQPQVLEQFDLPRDSEGAVIAQVARGGPAAAQGIRPGDLIKQVGRREVTGPGDVYKAVQAALNQGADGLVMLMQRGNQSQFVSVPLVRPDTG